ncbi:cyclase family protein [Alkalicella caledoniensis]|uniref:Cyclase family protein n=1 Tax=Alkalicella caledoniensis TaxID=2731377 RepID=A0A7G9W7P2_ALKCA|nr:cyclase family protein [Alkalicella caledoniensis]QNO14704.1 cyclase family protein [Alkalicella caledoniensis]
MNIVDLSQTIRNNMPVHPYDGPVQVIQDKELARDKYNNTRIEAGMHAGTHVDAPRHFLDNPKYICDYNLESFIGNGCLLDVRGEEIITLKDEYSGKVQTGDIVLLYTGQGPYFGKKGYYDGFENQPTMDLKLANFFIDKKIKLLGVDMASPDNMPFKIHKALLDQDIFIMENLTNLDMLLAVPKFEVIALPLKIEAEASIVRAIARY